MKSADSANGQASTPTSSNEAQQKKVDSSCSFDKSRLLVAFAVGLAFGIGLMMTNHKS